MPGPFLCVYKLLCKKMNCFIVQMTFVEGG